jgi:hypothetical protein
VGNIINTGNANITNNMQIGNSTFLYGSNGRIDSTQLNTTSVYSTNVYPQTDGGDLYIQGISSSSNIHIGKVTDKLFISGNISFTGNVANSNVTNLDVSNNTITLNTGNATTIPVGTGIYVDGNVSPNVQPSITIDNTGNWVFTNLVGNTYSVSNIDILKNFVSD